MDYYGTYKYHLPMVPAERNINYIIKQFTETNIDHVLSGKYDLLISPIYRNDSNQYFYQPIFDIDFKLSSRGTAFLLVKKFIEYNKKIASNIIVEYTGSGFHLVLNKAYKIDLEDLPKFRSKCNIYRSELDCTSSFRSTPIRRIGGIRNGKVIIPIPISFFLTSQPKDLPIIKDHLSFASKKEWIVLLKKYLVPKYFIEEKFDIQILDF